MGRGKETEEEETGRETCVAQTQQQRQTDTQTPHTHRDTNQCLYACNIGPLLIRIGFRGILYYNYNQEPQNSIGNYLSLYSMRTRRSTERSA